MSSPRNALPQTAPAQSVTNPPTDVPVAAPVLDPAAEEGRKLAIQRRELLQLGRHMRRTRQLLREQWEHLGHVNRQLTQKLEQQRQEQQQWLDKLKHEQGEYQQLRQNLEQERKEQQQLAEKLRQENASHQALARQLEQQRQEQQQWRSERDSLEKALAGEVEKTQQQQQANGRFEAELKEQQQRLAQAEAEIQQARQTLAEAEEEVAGREQELAQQQQELAQRQADLDQMVAELKAKKEAGQAQQNAPTRAVLQENEQLKQLLADQRTLRQEYSDNLKHALVEQERLRQENERLQSQLDGLRQQETLSPNAIQQARRPQPEPPLLTPWEEDEEPAGPVAPSRPSAMADFDMPSEAPPAPAPRAEERPAPVKPTAPESPPPIEPEPTDLEEIEPIETQLHMLDLDACEAELTEFRSRLEADRRAMDEELRRLQLRRPGDGEENATAWDHAELARERTQLDRLRETIRTEMERLQEEASNRVRPVPPLRQPSLRPEQLPQRENAGPAAAPSPKQGKLRSTLHGLRKWLGDVTSRETSKD